MSESANHEGGLPVAVVSLLALLAVAAMLVSGWRFVSLYSQLGAARQAQSEADAAGSRTVVDRLSLPVNRPLQICNHGAEGKVTALAAFYWTAEGAVAQFNSAQEGWFNWPLPAGKTAPIQWTDGSRRLWDGSAVFYAAEVQRGTQTQVVAGTSANLDGGGCAVAGKD
jgi:hypothetical protein